MHWNLKHALPTLRDVAAHHGHVALVYEVSQRHVPAGGSAFPSVAAPLSCQVVDIDARVLLHHSNCIVGFGDWGNSSMGINTVPQYNAETLFDSRLLFDMMGLLSYYQDTEMNQM